MFPNDLYLRDDINNLMWEEKKDEKESPALRMA